MSFEKKIKETKEKKAKFEEECKDVLEKLIKITAKKATGKALEELTKEPDIAKDNFKKHDNNYSRLCEEMKSLNVKRKKTIQLSKNEKENYEKIKQIPESNDKKIAECQKLLAKHEKEEQKQHDEALENLKLKLLSIRNKKKSMKLS